ncbi:hypothetical protein L2E82_01342 [Cichorium intybus]|uniref:Uncharacterized protein n=1 Tax=Cichorium intybus TaxID=13427 RepID=A0ACB9GZB3_CICIN|nr:hypothetical protein L2E82_01342 [Cichorium intybus]
MTFDSCNCLKRIPSVGLGTWQSEPGVVGDAIAAAIKVNLLSHTNLQLIAVLNLYRFVSGPLLCCDHAPEDVPAVLDRYSSISDFYQ